MSKIINVTQAIIPDEKEFVSHIEDIFNSRTFTNNGLKVCELEKALKSFLNVNYLIPCTNGTIGLEIAIHAAGANGKKIITTPFTYVATVSAPLWVGCEVVFADINEETLSIDTTNIERLMDDKVAAVIPVNVYGYPCEYEGIRKVVSHAKIIFDAAQAFGSKYKGKSLFDYGDFSICSMHATKAFHTFEGGFVVCHSAGDYQKLELLRAFGHRGDQHYCLGINAKMSEAHAACGLSLLGDFQNHLQKRKEITAIYDNLIDFQHLRKPIIPENFEYNYSYYPIIFDTEKVLIKSMVALQSNNIYPRRYFYPSLNLLPYIKHQSCPVSESIAPRVLCLPLYSGLEHEKVAQISDIVNRITRSF